MATLDITNPHFWDGAVIVILLVWRLIIHTPKVLAMLLVPLIKFIAGKSGAYAINAYLDENYPSRRQRKKKAKI